jgi:dihydrofolate reductase
MELVIVAAVAENGVIGVDGGMPWHYPDDLKHFRETTTGHPVVMGRRTFESIADRLGEPLPDRTSVVLTTRDPEELSLDSAPERDDVLVVDSVEAAIDAAEATGADVAYVIGGASVYEQFLPRADRLLITEIAETYQGDTYFPEFEESEWIEVDRDGRAELAFVTYERRRD